MTLGVESVTQALTKKVINSYLASVWVIGSVPLSNILVLESTAERGNYIAQAQFAEGLKGLMPCN